MNHTDYYVYAHRDLNGIVFYIGKGRKNRAYSKMQRSKQWKTIADAGFTVELLHENLEELHALSLEEELINNPQEGWNLTNQIKKINRKALCPDLLNSFLYYDESSPTFLRWRIDRYGGENGVAKIANAGDIAGSISRGNSRGYGAVIINYEKYAIHRAVYVMFNGAIPDGYIVNHKDNNHLNNSILNLEACPSRFNTRRTKSHNGGLMSTNNSGFTGVSKMVDDRYWSARWYENDKQKIKHFSIEKHGETEAFRLACEYRKQMIEKLNSEGAGYSVVE